jgi:CRP-like cAMP-binding protein
MPIKPNAHMQDYIEDTSKISSILQKLPVFAGLYPEEYEHIRHICLSARVNDGETLFTEGDSSPCMYVLLSGEVQLRTCAQGLIHTLRPGELFGEIGLISQKKRTATAIACAPIILLQINGDAFRLLLGREPRISFAIMRNITLNLAEHIVRMNKSNILDYIPPDVS